MKRKGCLIDAQQLQVRRVECSEKGESGTGGGVEGHGFRNGVNLQGGGRRQRYKEKSP